MEDLATQMGIIELNSPEEAHRYLVPIDAIECIEHPVKARGERWKSMLTLQSGKIIYTRQDPEEVLFLMFKASREAEVTIGGFTGV